jgi:hypothetical protein
MYACMRTADMLLGQDQHSRHTADSFKYRICRTDRAAHTADSMTLSGGCRQTGLHNTGSAGQAHVGKHAADKPQYGTARRTRTGRHVPVSTAASRAFTTCVNTQPSFHAERTHSRHQRVGRLQGCRPQEGLGATAIVCRTRHRDNCSITSHTTVNPQRTHRHADTCQPAARAPHNMHPHRPCARLLSLSLTVPLRLAPSWFVPDSVGSRLSLSLGSRYLDQARLRVPAAAAAAATAAVMTAAVTAAVTWPA